MKNIKYLPALFLIVTFISCQDFLEEDPQSLLTEAQFYNTEADFKTALTSAYEPMQRLYNGSIGFLTSVDTDEVEQGNFPGGGEVDDFQSHSYGAGSNTIRGWWNTNYEGINRCNAIVFRGDDVSLPAEEQELVERYILEARFLRGLYYFNLVLAFGDVPLNLNPTSELGLDNLLIPRSDKGAVYEQIEDDLGIAENGLPDSYGGDDEGRVTSGAATAMLAKVYLFQNKFSEARAKALDIINSGAYSLFPDYLDVLNSASKNGVEHIFSVQYARGLTESSMGRLYGFSSNTVSPIDSAVPDEIKGQSAWGVEQGFFDEFPDNYRKEVSLLSRFLEEEGGGLGDAGIAHSRKYFDPTKDGADSNNNDNNYNIIRYADILLIFAEAENELNGPTLAAYDAINQVRRRASQLDVNTPDPSVDLSGLVSATFKQAVLEERKWELAFEGHRRWDLIRTGTYLQEIADTSQRNILFPIPQAEIDINPELTQNDGY